jgi:hypothetical protein
MMAENKQNRGGEKKENVEINDDENLHAHLQVKTIQILSSPLSRDMKRKEFTPHILFAFFFSTCCCSTFFASISLLSFVFHLFLSHFPFFSFSFS